MFLLQNSYNLQFIKYLLLEIELCDEGDHNSGANNATIHIPNMQTIIQNDNSVDDTNSESQNELPLEDLMAQLKNL